MFNESDSTFGTAPLLSASAVARHLGVHQATIYRFAKEGQIPVVHIGRAMRFDLQAVLQALVINDSSALAEAEESNNNPAIHNTMDRQRRTS